MLTSNILPLSYNVSIKLLLPYRIFLYFQLIFFPIHSKISCNQIKINGERKGIKYTNGFYIAKKSEVDIRTLYCDMTSDDGAWTLLVTSIHGNWTKSQVSVNRVAPKLY